MKNQFKAKLVKFECCNSFHLFTRLREFASCTCGSSFYDAGDGFYARRGGTITVTKCRVKNNG